VGKLSFHGHFCISGTGTAVIVKTGSATEYGEIVKKTIERAPATEFEKELKGFSLFVTKTIFFLVIFSHMSL
jgi:Mg2+-importing ATPase